MNSILTWFFAMLAPFGSWESPITTDSIVQEAIRFSDLQTEGDALYWLELHPQEKGRYALVHYDGNERELLTDRSVRTRVHEYGGGAYSISEEGILFSDDSDRQLYLRKSSGEVEKITDAPNCRFADGCGRVWVVEEHKDPIENSLSWIEKGGVKTIASGHDFYSCPRLSPDQKQLAYITWDLPNMQWDSSTLMLADIDENGNLSNPKIVAGGADESVCQIQWSLDGVLHFVSDKTGFWNLYRYRDGEAENLCEMEAEFGPPPWVFGNPSYSFLSDGRIACTYVIKAVSHLGLLDPESGVLVDLHLPFTAVSNLVSASDKIYFIGATPYDPSAIIAYDFKHDSYKRLKKSLNVDIAEEWISTGQMIEYPAQDGKKGYGFYYPPQNPNFRAPDGERPPLIVKAHGGPTGHSWTQFMIDVQYWTTRGFAFVDVNYGGSTGFGREYFKRLEKNWGIVDVEDCISAANLLVDKGLADRERLLIRGGSAGGYTTLAALAFTDVFAGGTSYFGISDLELMIQDDHKFESRYVDLLVGSFPQEKEAYRKRSPINSIDQITKPILLLQGEEDKIVLPNQSTLIFNALREKKIPTGMILFEGEGHGFRQAPNIKRAFEAELYFYGKILHLDLADTFDEPPVEIH